jgi:glycosyltransferase involved in cell wall biosynthesis
MKKILIFSLSYFPKHVGGAEVAIKEKTARMPEYEFHLICLRYDSTLPKVEKIGNVVVHRIGFATANPTMADLRKFPLHLNKFTFQFAAAWKAMRLHAQYHFDCTWAMMAHACGVPAAIFKFRYPKVPFVLELQEGDPPEYIERKMRILWPLFSRAFTSADVVSVISTFLGKWARRRGFKGPVVLVPNAVNTRHFSQEYPIQTIAEIQHDLGKKAGDVFVITTSRLVHKNAVDDAINALPLLPENVHFVILGTGPDETMLRALVKQKGVERRTHFVGQIGHEALPKYLKACDIFSRASRSEGMGNSFVEAMAAGLPVIATQEGGISDFLFDEKRDPDKPTTGWAVDKDSPEQIAVAIRDIIQRPEKVREVVVTAKQMVEETYDWDKVSTIMKNDIFEPLLTRG